MQAEKFTILRTLLPCVEHKQRQHEQKVSHMFSPLFDVPVCSTLLRGLIRACLHGGEGPQVGEVTRFGG